MIGFHLINFNTLYESYGMYVYPINDRLENNRPLPLDLIQKLLKLVPKPCSYL